MKIRSADIEINVTDEGVGRPVLVFLHYWGGSSGTWAEVIRLLRGEFRCVAIDARGAGNSDAPRVGYSTQDHAQDVTHVIESLGIDRYILVGHSVGGKAAQLVASERPAGLAALVLIASSPLAPMAIDDAMRERMKLAYGSRESVEWTLDNVLLGSPIPSGIRERLIMDSLRLSPEATVGWVEIGTREDFSSRATDINVPVAIVAGDADRVDPVSVVKKEIIPFYPAPSVQFLRDKGHLLPVEAPEAVADVIRSMAKAASSG